MKTLIVYLLLISLTWNLFGCGTGNSDSITLKSSWTTNPIDSSVGKLEQTLSKSLGKLSEAAPPQLIQELNQNFEQSYPEVAILSPNSEEVFENPNVPVKIQIKNFSIFENKQLEIGPHLNLIVDNQIARPIYDLNEPITLKDLAPGSHSLRVFAVRPWGESFKNQQAYAQTTFHILTKTDNNRPNANLPLLTYNLPVGEYGAEPILFDFYLTNVPLHLVAQENPDDDLKDWRIRVTVNGENFLLDRWQPFYLRGFKKGNNWVQLELVDEEGNNIENAFNNTVRLVTYDPTKQNTLAKLVKGKISRNEAIAIVDSNNITQYARPEEKARLEREIDRIEKQLETPTNPELNKSDSLNSQELKAVEQRLETPTDSKQNKSDTLNSQEIKAVEKRLETPAELESTKPETAKSVEPTSTLEKSS